MLKIADDEVMQNAKIIDTFLGIEKEHGIFTWRLTFKMNDSKMFSAKHFDSYRVSA